MRLRILLALAGAALFAAMPAQASVQISSNPTHDMNCADGVCSPTARKANLNATDLANMLATSDVKVVTGNGAVTIGILSPLTWASTNRLTLDANESVNIKAPVVVEGTAGLTIVTNEGGTGGDLMIYPGGKVDFWDTSSSLIINQASYTLISTVPELGRAIKRATRHNRFALSQDYDAIHDKFRRSPVGEKFLGIFEGLGHSISNLTIASTGDDECVGLFSGTVDWQNQGILRDIILHNANVSALASHGSAGTLVGCSGGIILYAASDGRVVENGTFGTAGGLAGNAYYISRSHANVAVTAGLIAGGLMGQGNAFQSYALGTVSGTSDKAEVGGLAGSGQCSQSFATGNVTGGTNSAAGGLIGGSGDADNSYASGSVTGGEGSRVGGLLGYSNGPWVVESYSTGNVSGGDNSIVGGFGGQILDSVGLNFNYWDLDTSGTSKNCGVGGCSNVVGLTDAKLKSGLPSGFGPPTWAQNPNINNGYPYLIANPPPQ